MEPSYQAQARLVSVRGTSWAAAEWCWLPRWQTYSSATYLMNRDLHFPGHNADPFPEKPFRSKARGTSALRENSMLSGVSSALS